MSNTKLTGKVQAAPNKSLGFDADSKISLATAQSFDKDITYIDKKEGQPQWLVR